jgi:hypothetical protein
MRRALLAVPAFFCTLTLSLPARADGFDAADKAMDSLVARIFSEQNIGLLFGLLRQNLAATAEGRQAPEVTPEAAARIEATSKEVQREMATTAMLLLDGIEKEMRDTVRDGSRP